MDQQHVGILICNWSIIIHLIFFKIRKFKHEINKLKK